MPASVRKTKLQELAKRSCDFEIPLHPVSSCCLRFDGVLTFYRTCFILRAGIAIEYQLQVRDVFRIRLETGCPVGTKPRVEIQYLRPCDDDGPKRPIETERLSVAEIAASGKTKERETLPVSLCPESKDRIGLLFPRFGAS